MTTKIVDDLKKNRFSIFNNNIAAGSGIFSFEHIDGNTSYNGAVILTTVQKDSGDFTSVGVYKSIFAFEITGGLLSFREQALIYVNGTTDITFDIIDNAGQLTFFYVNDGGQLDMRLDFEFIMADDDYMIYIGKA